MSVSQDRSGATPKTSADVHPVLDERVRALRSQEPPAQASKDNHAVVHDAARLAIYVMFICVATLLFADLHSSYVSPSSKWETNPLINVLAERFGMHSALAGVKAADLLCIGVLFALWRRSRAHLTIGFVLSIIASQYLPVVFDNYFG